MSKEAVQQRAHQSPRAYDTLDQWKRLPRHKTRQQVDHMGPCSRPLIRLLAGPVCLSSPSPPVDKKSIEVSPSKPLPFPGHCSLGSVLPKGNFALRLTCSHFVSPSVPLDHSASLSLTVTFLPAHPAGFHGLNGQRAPPSSEVQFLGRPQRNVFYPQLRNL